MVCWINCDGRCCIPLNYVNVQYDSSLHATTVPMRKAPSMAMLIVERADSDSKSTKTICRTSSITTSTSNRKAKSTACTGAFILFFTMVVLFVLASSLHPSEDPRLLVTFPYKIRSQALLGSAAHGTEELEHEDESFGALEGLGTLFHKGTRAMPELIVAHLTESTTAEDLRFFLRGLHRSGTPARADVVLLFPWRPLSPELREVIHQEERFFQKLLATKDASATGDATLSAFNSGAYTRAMSDFAKQESVWGKKRTIGREENWARNSSNLGGQHLGAVVGFDMQELDPDDTLRGFMDSSPAVLRRWLCYQILLGMVRHRYRHVFLTEVTGVFILNDVFATLKRKDTSVHLFSTNQQWSRIPQMERLYGKSVEEGDKTRKLISAGVILGGTHQVRTLAIAMATEIVRVAILRKSRTPFRGDSLLLSFLVHKSSILGKKVTTHLQIHERDASSINLLAGSRIDDEYFRRKDHHRFAVVQGLKNDGVPTVKIMELLRRDICRSHRDIEIYADCFMTIAIA